MTALPRELSHEIADAEGRFVVQHFAVLFKLGRSADGDEHRAIAAFAREPSKVSVNLRDARGLALSESFDDLFVEASCFGVEARGRTRLESMTQVAARDKGRRASKLLYGARDADAEAYVVFVGKKTVAERDAAPAPTVAHEEVERHGGAVIQLARLETCDAEAFFLRGLFNRGEEFRVERRVHGCVRGAEVGKIAAQTRAVVSDKGALFERRVRGNEND